jgi:hypothetical protein
MKRESSNEGEDKRDGIMGRRGETSGIRYLQHPHIDLQKRSIHSSAAVMIITCV